MLSVSQRLAPERVLDLARQAGDLRLGVATPTARCCGNGSPLGATAATPPKPMSTSFSD